MCEVAIVDHEHVGVFVEPGSFRHALVVFSGEYAAEQRRPDGGAQQLTLEESLVLNLNLLTVVEIILSLFNNRLNQPVLLADHVGLGYLVFVPFACTPVVSVAFADYPVKCPTDLLHRRLEVGAVAKYHIHIIKSQLFQTVPQSFDYVFSRKTSSVRDRLFGFPEHFRTEHEVMARDVQ